MRYVINPKLNGYLCIIIICYFAGVTLYSLLPELQDNYLLIEYFDFRFLPHINYNSKWWYIFYWANNTLLSPIIYHMSKFIIYKPLNILVSGLSIFLLTLGVFQILKLIFEFQTPVIWVIYCTMYIVSLLTFFLYGHIRSNKK